MKGGLTAAALRLPGVFAPRTGTRPETAVTTSSMEAALDTLANTCTTSHKKTPRESIRYIDGTHLVGTGRAALSRQLGSS